MHVVDRRLLLAHLEREYVADRDHAGKAALGHDEPTDAPLAHELGGLEHGFPRLHRDDVTALSGKNVLDGRHVPASWLGFPRYYRAVPGCATLSRPPEAGASMAQARINVGPLDAHARQVAGALAIIGGLTALDGFFQALGFPLLILSVLDAWLPLIHKGYWGLLAGIFVAVGAFQTARTRQCPVNGLM